VSLADRRKEYGRATLDRADLDASPFAQFERWFDQAAAAGVAEPTVMSLATASAAGRPSVRIVLLKGVDERGFVFYTNYRSQKAEELGGNPQASLLFFWQPVERQVRITGRVEKVTPEESDQYFATRPRESQVGAWASDQSAVLARREDLDDAVEAHRRRFGDGPIDRPPHWGGYRLIPDELEFWQGRPSRLHDRFRYRLDDGRWIVERLSP